MGHRRLGDGRRHCAAVSLAGSDLGGGRGGLAGRVRPVAVGGRLVRHPQGPRRLLLPRRHDADCRGGAPGRRLRLACGARRGARARLAATAVCAGLRGRHRGHGAAVERRDRRRSHARGLCRDQGRRRDAAALSVHLRLHRQRGEFCAAHFQSGQPGGVRRPHAASGGVARAIRPAVGHRDCRDLSGVTADAAPGAGGGEDRGDVGPTAARPWRAPHHGRHRRGCRRAVVLLGFRRAARIADLGQRRGDDRDRAGIEPPVAVAGAQRRVVGRAAAGRRLVRSGGSARSHRSHCRTERAASMPKSHAQARPPHGAPALSSRWRPT